MSTGNDIVKPVPYEINGSSLWTSADMKRYADLRVISVFFKENPGVIPYISSATTVYAELAAFEAALEEK